MYLWKEWNVIVSENILRTSKLQRSTIGSWGGSGEEIKRQSTRIINFVYCRLFAFSEAASCLAPRPFAVP